MFFSVLLKAMDARLQVGSIYLNFQKVFDQIDHFIFIGWLQVIGLSDLLLELFQSYLINRNQYIEYRGFCSSYFTHTSAVLQNSNLGPFYIIFIDFLAKISINEYHLYADDMKLKKKSNVEDSLNPLNNLDWVFDVY